MPIDMCSENNAAENSPAMEAREQTAGYSNKSFVPESPNRPCSTIHSGEPKKAIEDGDSIGIQAACTSRKTGVTQYDETECNEHIFVVCKCRETPGILRYKLFVGQPPFYTDSVYVFIRHIVKDPVKYPDNMSANFKSCLKGLLNKIPGCAAHPSSTLFCYKANQSRRRPLPVNTRAIQKANCYHREGHDAPCFAGGDGYYMLLFGVAQVVLSQIPDFHNMAWLSVFAAVMSFFYSIVGFGLGVAKVIANGVIKGGIGGIVLVSPTQKVWRISQALGDIAFAYPYSLVLLEIEDTLRSPPPESETMKTASRASIVVTTFFYLCCGCFGYAAFGDGTPGNLFTGFGFYEPYWLIDLANLCIVLHLLGGYQVYAQPVFALVERRFGAEACVVEVPLLGQRRVSLFRLCFRMVYVAATTALAVWFPYFNQVIGLLSAFTFWPLAIHFPVEMYLVQKKVAPWTRRWLATQAFSAVCLLISIFASVGSAVGVFSSETS